MNKPFYLSKKFWGSIATIVALLVGPKFGISEGDLEKVFFIGLSFVGATGLADFGKNGS